jgi:hypothetical protein
MRRFTFLVAAGACSLLACGSTRSGVVISTDAAEYDTPPTVRAMLPVQAGAYRLSMSVPCKTSERTATGTLTLRRISGAEQTLAAGQPSERGEAALLWGQTDLDFEPLRRCLGASVASREEEPIHPSVLVDVLQWDGEPHHQVLLVSTDRRGSGETGALSGSGVAMWVERVEQGHIAGVWSRWELIGQSEGRWQAEWIRAVAQASPSSGRSSSRLGQLEEIARQH